MYDELRQEGSPLAIGSDISALFADPLNPISAKVQSKVQVPEGLDLDAWINEPPPEEEEAETNFEKGFDFLGGYSTSGSEPIQSVEPNTPEIQAARRARRLADPYYLGSTPIEEPQDEDEDIPTLQLDAKALGGIKGKIQFFSSSRC